jgi:acetyl esterase/lipase
MNRFVLLCLPLFFAAPLLAQRADGPALPQIKKDIPYVTKAHERQKLDLYLPKKSDQKSPLLVWVHGGAWKEGNKEKCPALGLLQKGWAVASINYRFSQHAIFPAQLEDCKSAIRWLRAHADENSIDPQRISVWGASAGGHLVALLATTANTREFDVGEYLEQSSAICCAINWFGPADFLKWSTDSIVQPQNKDDVVAKLFGGTVQDKVELAKKGSPIYWVSKSSAPMLHMHGDRDTLVPLQQSETFHAALQKAGATSVLQVYPGQGHGGPKFSDAAAVELMTGFLDEHTKPIPLAIKSAEAKPKS